MIDGNVWNDSFYLVLILMVKKSNLKNNKNSKKLKV